MARTQGLAVEGDRSGRPQEDVVRFLLDPTTHGVERVGHIETHISHVFLTGTYAYKMKKSVKLDFVDFSTLRQRMRACRNEIVVNSRTAPDIYIDVVAVNEIDGHLELGVPLAPVEYLVRMNQFRQDDLLDRIAAEDRLTVDLARGIADAAGELHLSAARMADDPEAEPFATTASDLMNRLTAAVDSAETQAIVDSWRNAVTPSLERNLPHVRARARHGAVRHGHGDLHLGNICVYDGQVRLFDAIEFQPRFSHIDILYDVAFVLMDLLHRGQPAIAQLVLSRYLAATRDYSGLDLLRLFMSVRAAVRALVALLGPASDRVEVARTYLELAERVLEQRGAGRLIAIGGRSGTGKSTLAQDLAAHVGSFPDIVVMRSDEVRKRMMGRRPEERLGSNGYGHAVSRRVYRRLFRDAARAFARGRDRDPGCRLPG